jgi:hypothetical protein
LRHVDQPGVHRADSAPVFRVTFEKHFPPPGEAPGDPVVISKEITFHSEASARAFAHRVGGDRLVRGVRLFVRAALGEPWVEVGL